MSDNIKITNAGGVLTLTLSRIEKKNALTNAMYAALADALEAAEQDPSVRVVLLQAEGDMFTTGNDLTEFADAATNGIRGERHVVRFLRALANASLPLIAAVQGRAVGIGTTMLLHCDLVLVAENAILSTPFVNLALVPEAASSLLMPARIGYVRAFEMFAFGAVVDAHSAVTWGLVNKSVPLDRLASEASTMARSLAKQPSGALKSTKRLMRNAQMLAAQMNAESECFVQRLQTAEAREAFKAFAERRPPNFSTAAG